MGTRLTPEMEKLARASLCTCNDNTNCIMASQMLAEIDALRGDVEDEKYNRQIAESDLAHVQGKSINLIEAYDLLKSDNERLKKIITKQVCHEDDLGYEFTYVICLKEENQKLRARIEKLRAALEQHSDADILNPGVRPNTAGRALVQDDDISE